MVMFRGDIALILLLDVKMARKKEKLRLEVCIAFEDFLAYTQWTDLRSTNSD